MSSRNGLLPAGLALAALLVAVGTVRAAGAEVGQEPGGEQPTRAQAESTLRLPLELKPDSRWSYAVRRNDWNPLSNSKPAAGDDENDQEELVAKGGAVALRFDLEAKKIEDSGSALLELAISGLARPSQEADEEPAERTVFVVQVSRDGRIERMELRQSQASAANELAIPLEEIRAGLRAILGTGLHSSPLKKGETYQLDAQSEPRAREAAATEGLDEPAGFEKVLLRFDAVRETGGQKLAAFTLFQAAESPTGDEVGLRAGEAAYSARDGLLAKLSYQPSAAAEEGRSRVDWLHIERIED